MKIRKAVMEDAGAIREMIEEYKFMENGSGFLLPLNADALLTAIENSDFFVACEDGKIAGCASVVEYDGIAELRSLAVKHAYMSMGIGSQLIDRCIAESQERGYGELYALTQTYRPFEKKGFVMSETPPQKMKNYCAKCPLKDNGCKEFAVVYKMKSDIPMFSNIG